MYRSINQVLSMRFSCLIKPLPLKYSTQPVVKKEDFSEETTQLKEYEKISKITPRLRMKKPQKPPFAKNLFLGIFDTDILAYPEIENDELKELEKGIQAVEVVLQQPEIKECSSWSKDFMQKLGNERLIGLQSLQLRGGRELALGESLRYFEALSDLNLRDSVIANETLGLQILLKFGTDQQKVKYLQKLMSGQSISAFCTVIEPYSSNLDKTQRTALLSQDSKTWILNGENKLVVNGSSADFLIVLAHTDTILKGDIQEKFLSAFIIDRDSGGITSSKLQAVSPNLEISNIKFDNVQIPSDNLIGKLNEGETILTAIYSESRLSIGPLCSNLQKKLIAKVVSNYIEISKEPFPLYETDAVRCKIGELVTSSYAIDSMIYLTAGLLDTYENQDCELESTIVKVFASEQSFQNTFKCLSLIGPETKLNDHWCTNFHKESIKYLNFPDSNSDLKIIIALLGLRYAGNKMNSTIKKLRNPFHHSAFVLKRMWQQHRQEDDNPKLTLYLNYHLHPSSTSSARNLEYCVLRLQYATEMLFTRYGPEIVNRHMDLERLANSIIDIYAMVACIGRASRSYCIGLQHSESEMVMAESFCRNAMFRVKQNVLDILSGNSQTTDDAFRSIGKKAFNSKGYFPVHPLSRNF